MNITYISLIKFIINQKIITRKEIAEKLNVDKSNVTRWYNGKAKQANIDQNAMLTLLTGIELENPDMHHKIYRWLQSNNIEDDTSDIDAKYNDAKKVTSIVGKTDLDPRIVNFFSSIIKQANNNKENGIYNNSYEEKTSAPSKRAFSTFKNPMIKNFVGRSDVINEIEVKLNTYGLAIVCGTGGLGKSQSVLHYADQHKSYQNIQLVYFQNSLKETICNISFENLKKSDDIDIYLDALALLNDESLLIIDNMDIDDLTQDDQNILEKLLDMPLHVLITSRNKKLYAEQYMIPISTLLKPQQLELFKLNYCVPNGNELPQLPEKNIPKYKEICDLVDGHTMVIELIAKTMREYSMSPTKMINILRDGSYKESDMSVDFKKDNKYEHGTIDNVISILFNISDMDDSEKTILMKLSLCSVVGIRMSFFNDYLLDGRSIRKISNLINQSWIIRDLQPASENDRIHLHPLINTAVHKNMDISLNLCKDYLFSAIKVFSHSKEEITASDRKDVCEILINAGKTFKDQYSDSSIDLLLDQIDFIYDSHQYAQAEKQCDLAINICRNSQNDTVKSSLPRALYLHANVSVKLANYQVAISDYKDAIELWENAAISPYERIVEAYNQLANVYRKDSQYPLALDNFKVAENRFDIYKINNPLLRADIYNNLGIVYINLGELQKSLDNYKKGRDIRESQEVPDRKQLAYSYHNIGTVYQRLHKYQKALEWHQKAFNLRLEIYTPDDSILADSLTMIGNDYSAMATNKSDKAFQKAIQSMQRGLTIRKNSLGLNHPATAWSYQSLGCAYYKQNNFDLALDNFQKCLNIRQAKLGDNHAYTAEIHHWLGKAFASLQNKEDAIYHLKTAADIYQENSMVDKISKVKADISKFGLEN